MTNDWILDVLSDLRRFSRQNGLTHLATHLDDAELIALAEIANQTCPAGSADVMQLSSVEENEVCSGGELQRAARRA